MVFRVGAAIERAAGQNILQAIGVAGGHAQQAAARNPDLHRQAERARAGGDRRIIGHRGLHRVGTCHGAACHAAARAHVVGEDHGQRVAAKLAHDPAVIVQQRDHAREIAIEDQRQILRAAPAGARERFAHGCEAGHIGEQRDGMHAPRAADLERVGPRRDRTRQVLGQVWEPGSAHTASVSSAGHTPDTANQRQYWLRA